MSDDLYGISPAMLAVAELQALNALPIGERQRAASKFARKIIEEQARRNEPGRAFRQWGE